MNEEISLMDLIEKDIMSFEGVSRFPGIGITGNIQKAMLGRDRINPGIRISEEDGSLVISCEIIVYFGINIPQLCYDIQTRIKQDIESSTDLSVKAVNIRVEGLDKAEQPI